MGYTIPGKWRFMAGKINYHMGLIGMYPLVICYSLLLKMAHLYIYIAFTYIYLLKVVIFYSYMLICQGVNWNVDWKIIKLNGGFSTATFDYRMSLFITIKPSVNLVYNHLE